MKLKKKSILIIIAAVVVVFFVSFATVKAIKAKEQGGIPVDTSKIEKQDIESNIFTSGTVISKDVRELTCDLTGKVQEVMVDEGYEVKKGDILAKLDSGELQYKIQQTELRLEIAKAKLEKLKKEDRDNVEVIYKNAEIQYNDALQDYENKKILYESGAISKRDLNNAKSLRDKSYNDFILAKKNYEEYGQESEITIQEKELKAIELELEKYKSDLEKTKITSPIDGTVTRVNISELSIVGQNTLLFVIEDTDNLEVITNISEYDINKVSLGQSVRVTGEGIKDKEYRGVVKYISPSAETIRNGQSTETVVEVKIDIEDKDTEFKPNFSANVEINTGSKKGALVVPYEAIYTTKEGNKVIFTIENNKAKEHIIETGIQGDVILEVMSPDLKEGQMVILNPNENIKDGTPLKVEQRDEK